MLVLVSRLHRGIMDALNYARLVSEDVRAVYIETNPGNTHGPERGLAGVGPRHSAGHHGVALPLPGGPADALH